MNQFCVRGCTTGELQVEKSRRGPGKYSSTEALMDHGD